MGSADARRNLPARRGTLRVQHVEQVNSTTSYSRTGWELERLTPTQFKVLRGVHLGQANKQIAFELGIAEATVKAHMTALMRKLNARNRTQVALLAEKMMGADRFSFTEPRMS